MPLEPGMVTALLVRIRGGDGPAMNDLVALIQDDFRANARWQRLKEPAGLSLTTGDLVQEGLLRLLKGSEIDRAGNGRQLRYAFARAVRQFLVDHARKRRDRPRREALELDDLLEEVGERSGVEVLALDEGMTALAAKYPREAEVLELRFFGAYEVAEVAHALGVSPSTVERDARFARAWLHDYLTPEGEP